MFNLFRSQKQAVKIVLGGILSLVAVSMVITLIPGSWGAAADANQNVLAEVGDPTLWWLSGAHELTISDVQQAMADLTRGQTINPQTRGVFAQQTVDREITNLILMKEAEDLGISANEEELADWLKQQMPFLFIDGVFQSDQYRTFVSQRFRKSVPRFEDEVRRSLIVDVRLRRMVVDGVTVGEEELREIYRRDNEKTKLRFLKIRTEDFRAQVKPAQETLQAFYEERKLQYTIPESRGVKLMTIDTADLPQIVPDEAEVERYYRQNRQRYQVDESIRASHILLMTQDKSDDEKAALKQKAEEVLKELQAGADFAALANEHSDDTGTVDKGGDLGWVVRGQMVPNFEKASFALAAGELSEVISTEYGYHVIKVHERQGARVRPLEEVREEVRQELVQDRQYNARMKHVDTAIAAARKARKDLEAAAGPLNLKVLTLPKITRRSPPAAFLEFRTLTASLFAAGDSEVVTATQDEKTAIAVVTEIVPERQAEFDEVREQVRDQYVTQESRSLAEERAKELGEAATQDGLTSAARSFRIKPETSDFVRRSDSIPNLGSVGALGDDAFALETGKAVGPVRSGNDWVVYEVVERQEAEMIGFVDARDNLFEKEKARRQQQAFEIYREEVRQRFEQAGRVRRYPINIQRYVGQLSRGIY